MPAPTYTAEQLAELEAAYAQGVLSVGHGDKRITYRSEEEMARAIDRIRAAP